MREWLERTLVRENKMCISVSNHSATVLVFGLRRYTFDVCLFSLQLQISSGKMFLTVVLSSFSSIYRFSLLINLLLFSFFSYANRNLCHDNNNLQ